MRSGPSLLGRHRDIGFRLVACLTKLATDPLGPEDRRRTWHGRSCNLLIDEQAGRPPHDYCPSFSWVPRLPEHASLTVRTQRACSSIDRFHPGTAPIHRQLSSYYLNYQQLYYEYVATACMRPVAFIF